ncbi:MFS transporter [Roseateles depolymerans]|uniref:Uncharacterized protein n=1 Tax=Roseateles depolymerans TaxID=76731 RepID=A0A0U3LI66_9BURK|nr:MFS transporter [Roseateles depolymerans]ALV04535.1 hypothetical protein RD2015_29 [Roseateles depolymerans]REG14067.1 putative MFS family arabinose efflux permease [Roseateles depolymerans]
MKTTIQGESIQPIWLSLACCIGIGSLYYAQPLLLSMAQAFQVPISHLGWIPMASQLGGWLGVLLLLPLGDLREGRSLIVTLLGVNALGLAAVGLAPSFTILIASSLAVGFTTIVPYLLPPLASRLVSSERRGNVIGILAAGIFSGILISRGLSGWLGEHYGWRWPFLVGAFLNVAVALMLRVRLPRIEPHSRGNYRQLLGSMWSVLRAQPLLREAAFTQGLMFGAFNVFWLSLPLWLGSAPYSLGSSAVAWFAAVGLIGVFAAPRVGRLIDRFGSQVMIAVSTAISVVGWVVLFEFGDSLYALFAGVVLLDLGTTASHVSNQAKIFSLDPGLRSRIGTLYILGLFTAAAIVSPLTTWIWAAHGWVGVCSLGGALGIVAMAFNLRLTLRQRAATHVKAST